MSSMAMENSLIEQKTEPCGQCENSVETWSEPITCPFISDQEIPALAAFPYQELGEKTLLEGVEDEPLRSPPDDLHTRFFERVAKSTQWRSSGR